MANILLIEPNIVLARTYKRALTECGHLVEWVAGAQAGIHAADRITLDVIVLELQLPGHGGIEFLYEFRSYPEWNKVPVIVNTVVTPAALAPAHQVLQKQLGVRQILYKPRATLADIERAVRAHTAVA